MDWTTLQHALIALVCLGIGWMLGNPVAGAAVGITVFVVRELTQAEYRYIATHGGLRANLPWWGMFYYKVWDIGSLTDWLVPSVVVVSALILMFRLNL